MFTSIVCVVCYVFVFMHVFSYEVPGRRQHSEGFYIGVCILLIYSPKGWSYSLLVREVVGSNEINRT